MSEHDIVCVATTPSRDQAHIWRDALKAEGIECQVGEYLNYWYENTPEDQADVWVHRANAHQAREILATYDSPLAAIAGRY